MALCDWRLWVFLMLYKALPWMWAGPRDLFFIKRIQQKRRDIASKMKIQKMVLSLTRALLACSLLWKLATTLWLPYEMTCVARNCGWLLSNSQWKTGTFSPTPYKELNPANNMPGRLGQTPLTLGLQSWQIPDCSLVRGPNPEASTQHTWISDPWKWKIINSVILSY